MSKVSRFIQFNDESVETHKLILYEKLAQSLANAPYLHITERQLIEYQPKDSTIAMSVFWRHRSDIETHQGRLSDIYLLAGGFFRYFDLRAWRAFTLNKHGQLPIFTSQIAMLIEEFRLIEMIQHIRPGTHRSFTYRKKIYVAYHEDRLLLNIQRGHFTDALLNQLFLDIHRGTLASVHEIFNRLPIQRIRQIVESVYDSQSTTDSILIADRLGKLVESTLTEDLRFPLYTIGDIFDETPNNIVQTKGIDHLEQGNGSEKETIEEEFRAWHMETMEEEGNHVTFTLDRGTSGPSDSPESKPGKDDANIQQIGYGTSEGNEKSIQSDDGLQSSKKKSESGMGRAGTEYGDANKHVTFSVKTIDNQADSNTSKKIENLRLTQSPIVRAIAGEMKKQLERKQSSKRERLSKGRLSSNLLTILTDERPKPFYRKLSPSTELDAVFGLLVDGSASMLDKLEETKEAVLLFHDVLRELNISHEIVSYYEDAFEASKENQPNYFEVVHSFNSIHRDSSAAIMNLEAHEDNRDGFAIRWMAKRLANRTERHKFLLVFSDGEPSAYSYDRNGIIDTAEAVMESEKKGISVVHLFLSEEAMSEQQKTIFTSMFGSKTASADSVEDFANQTLRILRKLLAIATQ